MIIFVLIQVALIVTVALIGQQVAIQKCYSHQNEVLQQVENNLNVSLPQYLNTTAVEKFWNKLQKEVKNNKHFLSIGAN
jgi:long-subunit fatty acid transport protein